MLRRLLLVLVLLAACSPALAESVRVTINLSSQTMTVRVDGATIYDWAVSTGRKGYRTPTGTYHPTRMHRVYYSKKYDDAPMPNAIFFRGGYAIHGTYDTGRLGRPASHGCVRLSPGHAQALYRLVRNAGMGNTTIRIRG